MENGCDEKFHKIEKIGEGRYGVVYKGRGKDTGRYVALKEIHLEYEDQGVPSTAIREVSILKELRHQNVVSLLDVLQGDRRLCLVLEYMDEDLKMHLEKARQRGAPLATHLVKSYLWQLMQGAVYVHSRRIVHRDLKPQNVLINVQGILKLADFGLARTIGIPLRPYTEEVMALWFRAPEILLGARIYTVSVDMWSIGCIFAEMLMLRALFPGDSQICQIFCIFHAIGTPDETTWPGVTRLPYYQESFPRWRPLSLVNIITGLDAEGEDLIRKLLVANPADRLSAKDALDHRYFRDITI